MNPGIEAEAQSDLVAGSNPICFAPTLDDDWTSLVFVHVSLCLGHSSLAKLLVGGQRL